MSSGHFHWVIFPNNLTPVAVLLFSCFGRRASVMPKAWCASFGPCDILSGKTKQRRCIPLVKTERKVDPIKAVIMQCAPSKATRVSDAWEPRGFVHFHRPHIVMRDYLSLSKQEAFWYASVTQAAALSAPLFFPVWARADLTFIWVHLRMSWQYHEAACRFPPTQHKSLRWLMLIF